MTEKRRSRRNATARVVRTAKGNGRDCRSFQGTTASSACNDGSRKTIRSHSLCVRQPRSPHSSLITSRAYSGNASARPSTPTNRTAKRAGFADADFITNAANLLNFAAKYLSFAVPTLGWACDDSRSFCSAAPRRQRLRDDAVTRISQSILTSIRRRI